MIENPIRHRFFGIPEVAGRSRSRFLERLRRSDFPVSRKIPELLPLCATNEEHGGLRCCNEDEGWPLGVAFQREAPNRPLLLRPKGVVVSEWEPAEKPW